MTKIRGQFRSTGPHMVGTAAPSGMAAPNAAAAPTLPPYKVQCTGV
jgi:hypothetical protein